MTDFMDTLSKDYSIAPDPMMRIVHVVERMQKVYEWESLRRWHNRAYDMDVRAKPKRVKRMRDLEEELWPDA